MIYTVSHYLDSMRPVVRKVNNMGGALKIVAGWIDNGHCSIHTSNMIKKETGKHITTEYIYTFSLTQHHYVTIAFEKKVRRGYVKKES